MGDARQILHPIRAPRLFISRDRFGPFPLQFITARNVKVRAGEGRIHLQYALALRDCLFPVVRVVVEPCQVHGAQNIERSEIEGAPVFFKGLIEALPHQKVVRIPQVNHGVVGVQLDCPAVFPFRPSPVPVVPELDSGKSAMRLRKVRIEFERLCHRRARLGHRLGRVYGAYVRAQRCVATGQCRPCLGIARLYCGGLAEIADGLLRCRTVSLVPKEPAFQQGIVGLRIGGAPFGEPGVLFRRKFHLHLIGDALGHLSL